MYRNPRLSLSRAITPEAVANGIFDAVPWGVDVEQVGVNVLVKFGDSRSNRSGDNRAAHFVMDDEHGNGNTDVGRS